MRCGPHGCGEHGGRRSRARRAVDAAPQQWHTVRGHRLSQKSELPRDPRGQAWHAPGGLDWRPSARLAGTAWREDRAVLRAGRWARTGMAKPTRDRQALRQAQGRPFDVFRTAASAPTRATPETDRVRLPVGTLTQIDTVRGSKNAISVSGQVRKSEIGNWETLSRACHEQASRLTRGASKDSVVILIVIAIASSRFWNYRTTITVAGGGGTDRKTSVPGPASGVTLPPVPWTTVAAPR